MNTPALSVFIPVFNAGPFLAEMRKFLSPGQYATQWVRYKFMRPFQNLRNWFKKLGFCIQRPGPERVGHD